MEKHLILNSIGFGGGLFIGLIVLWFITRQLKMRSASDQSHRTYTPSSEISWEEKRRHPRLAVSWDAFIETSERTEDVQLKDISLGGAFVVCSEPLALSEKFKIRICIPTKESLDLNAEVVWSNSNMAGDKVVNRGMGIKFVENPATKRQQLEEHLAAMLESSPNPG